MSEQSFEKALTELEDIVEKLENKFLMEGINLSILVISKEVSTGVINRLQLNSTFR